MFPRRTLSILIPSALAIATFTVPAWSRVPGGEAHESPEPRLVLPGDRPIEPGTPIVLRWTAADSVSELEMLLSTDGGATYRQWISPRLDPATRAFCWTVPLGHGPLRVRIRYHRRGREIEGPPLELRTTDLPGSGARPLGLPPVTPVPSPRDEHRAQSRPAVPSPS